MELYSIGQNYNYFVGENKYLPFPNSAEHIIDKALSQGSESEQLEKVKGLVSILADKLLDAGLLKVEEIEYLFEGHPDGPFYKTEEEADELISFWVKQNP